MLSKVRDLIAKWVPSALSPPELPHQRCPRCHRAVGVTRALSMHCALCNPRKELAERSSWLAPRCCMCDQPSDHALGATRETFPRVPICGRCLDDARRLTHAMAFAAAIWRDGRRVSWLRWWQARAMHSAIVLGRVLAVMP